MPATRQQTLVRLLGPAPLDLLVVGGGITGAGIALEAARAGVRTGLIEAHDFASGTSSRSSKLVHGGLRYLRQGQLLLTREAVRERTALLQNAPGLVTPLEFVLPIRKRDRLAKPIYGAALAIYDLLAGAHTRKWLNTGQVLNRVPSLDADGLLGAWQYLDAQTDDARLVLRVLHEAKSQGATVINYVRMDEWLRNADGKVCGAKVLDTQSGDALTINAQCVINASGVWTDSLRRRLGGDVKIRPLRGSHLLFPYTLIPLKCAIAFSHPEDGRSVFALPWLGGVLVGTTDLDHHNDLQKEPTITAEETAYLMAALHAQFPSLAIKASDALSSWSGIRPVVSSDRSRKPSQEVREHFISDEEGLISVCGGKLTTFRSMARDVLKHAASRLPQLRGLKSVEVFATPNQIDSPEQWSNELYRHMLGRHGNALATLIDCAQPGELSPIPNTLTPWAELRYACREETVLHLDDLLLRRTRLGLLLPHGANALFEKLEAIIKTELFWDDAKWQSEISRYSDIIDQFYSVPRTFRSENS